MALIDTVSLLDGRRRRIPRCNLLNSIYMVMCRGLLSVLWDNNIMMMMVMAGKCNARINCRQTDRDGA